MYFPCDEVYYRMGNGWEKRTHTTGKVWIPISQFSPYTRFYCIFPIHGQLMGKPMYFPCDEVYYRMGNGWEKRPYTTGKVWIPISQFSPYNGFYCIFPIHGQLMGKPMYFSCDEVYHRMGIGWEKVPTLWKIYKHQFRRFSPYDGFCCTFPMLWGIDVKTNAFSIWWDSLIFSCVINNYYQKSYHHLKQWPSIIAGVYTCK